MRKKIQDKMFEASYIMEWIISFILMTAIGIEVIKMIIGMCDIQGFWQNSSALTEILKNALTLAVGVEFIKMLCKHSATAVIEVLLFATARQMVVEHLPPLDTLINVCAIAGLFATRRFLLTKNDITNKDNSLD